MKRRNFLDYSYFNKLLLHACGVLPLKSQNYIVNLLLVPTSLVSSFFVFMPVCILLPKRDKLSRLTGNCEKLWKYVESDEDSAIVEKYAKRGLYLTYGFAVNCLLGTSSCLITPLFMSFVVDANGTVLTSKKLPFSAGIFHENVDKFYLWHALQVPTAFDSVLAIVAIDTAISFYVLHACAHMRLCQTFFRRVNDDFTVEKALMINDVEWNTRRKIFFEHVVKCVSYHTKVLQYSKDVEDIFASVILVQTLQCITAICGYSFGALIGNETERPRSATCALSVTIQLLLLCWPPDTLQDESLKVATAAYNLPWYEWTTKEGKLIRMIIAKSQRPVTITARKFTIISLETFKWVLKTAFSMVTLLRRVLE